MHIVMHAGGIPFNGDTIKERSLGGSESAAYYTAKELAQRGHRVTVFTEHPEGGEFDGVTYLSMGERSSEKPMGVNWHFFCEHTPHEANIVQRQPGSFLFHIQSKVNLWWAHDIALKRNGAHFMAQLWQTDRVLPVSNWFKDQIADTWLIDPDLITPIHNGVDYSLYEDRELKDNSLRDDERDIIVIYSSRPERGLVNLVGENGIMEQLLEKNPRVKLKVCGYEHGVPNLEPFYQHLRDRIEELPNCEHLGQLTKEELATLQCEEADIWVYPTEFEEVSCITAMECMAAGLSIVTTNTAALPETIGDYENCVLFNYDDKIIDKFVDYLSQQHTELYRRRPLKDYTWARVASEFEEVIADCFKKYSEPAALSRHFLRNSDISALDHMGDTVDENVKEEVYDLYDTWRHDLKAYADHYAEGTEEMYDGPNFKYEPPEFVNHPRFIEVAKYIKANLYDGALVIDYGCAHGHFTNYLAQTFPSVQFLGVDVSPKAIAVAEAKAIEMGLDNVRYTNEDWLTRGTVDHKDCDLIVLGEILEHVADPVVFMDRVKVVVGSAKTVITTPIGPWESLSYERDWPKRFHLHHFERSDLEDMFGMHPDLDIRCLANGHTPIGELLGWYITTLTLDDDISVFPVDFDRKIAQTRPRQSVSFCMIAKDAETNILNLLNSVEPYVDEFVIGVDKTTTDDTVGIVNRFEELMAERNVSPLKDVKCFEIDSPLETGFDEARNRTIEKARMHWIMWGDADETFISGDRLPKYLRQNSWKGYGIPQHHFSTEPLGVLSTDFPVRIFRRDPDVRFRGVVHEHPENCNKPNDGVGYAYVLNELHYSHSGYSTEPVRRNRFMRNISLMARDREKYPDRLLGKFLWIRDLALMCRFDAEQTGGMVTPEMQVRAREGLQLWEDTLKECGDHPQVRRMVKDHLEFYDTLTNVLNEGFRFSIRLASGPGNQSPDIGSVPELSARFLSKEHLDLFLSMVIDEEVKDYEGKYL